MSMSFAEPSEPSRAVVGEEAGDRVAVVVGSSRPTRICPGVAAWIRDVLREGSSLRYELLDLAEVGLPLLDEPLKAALEQYEHEHTRQWSRTVLTYSGFLFVFPQYNWGYPAVVKNAVDFLYDEWHDKPATVASYGTHGGNKGAAQFLTVLKGVHMRPLDDHLELVITDDDVDDAWQLKDVNATLPPLPGRDQSDRRANDPGAQGRPIAQPGSAVSRSHDQKPRTSMAPDLRGEGPGATCHDRAVTSISGSHPQAGENWGRTTGRGVRTRRPGHG
ncbi:NADPH-dependent FMN reductase [Streptomyces sennicomposti]